MSGICGIVNFDRAPVEPETLERMVQAAIPRAVDGVGRWVRGHVGIANLRLNVTPESSREQQPEEALGGAVVLTASARLDNRDELIRLLRSKKLLATDDPTDAELILAAYLQWGREAATHILGDFAFVIWDERRQALFAARDPMGFRPLFYRHTESQILFGSEVKQILAVPGVPRRISEPAMGLHLAMATFQFPREWTFFEGIAQLPASCSMWCDASGLRTWRHWDIDPDVRIRYASEDEYVEHFRALFVESVRARLRSVRPMGVWLSGGLDSGSVASTAGWIRQRDADSRAPQIRAYSWAFETLQECDERHISDEIVREFGFAARYIPAEDMAPLRDLSAAVTDPDAPMIQVYTSLLDTALHAAKQEGVGLIFSGFRGDALLASGDFDYLDLLLAGRWMMVWNHLARHSARLSQTRSRVARNWIYGPLRSAVAASRPLSAVAYPVRERLYPHTRPYPAWVDESFARRVHLRETVQQPRTRVPLRGLARRERYRSVFAPLYERAAVEQERHNSTFGIGYADPWSDRRLAEFVLAVPQHVLSQMGEEKRLARLAMKGIMPEPARREAKKILPGPLFRRALREDARDNIKSLLTGSRLAAHGFVSEERLCNYYQSFLRGEQVDLRFWKTLTAELWLRRHWK